MENKTQPLRFYISAKSVLAEPMLYDTPLASSGQPVTSLVRPRGSLYHIKRDFELRDDDWVIFGVASTSDVDLVDEVIDSEYVFADSLEEFVNTGRIFWEHGYKLAGKVDADNPITAPIGVPYLAEIYNNELLVFIVLDKSHPTSGMIWGRLNQEDGRFNKQIGLSIGALPQGNPVKVKDMKTGNYVKKCPKMRLYEVSVTGQPINPHTWTEVVKSLLANETEEVMPKTAQNQKTKTVADKEVKKVVKAVPGQDPAEDEENLPMEAAEPEPGVDAAADDAGAAPPEMPAPDAGGDMDADMGGDPLGDPMAAGGDPMAAGGEDPMAAMGGDPMAAGGDPMAAGGDMGGDAEGMLDMLAGGEMGLDENPAPEADVATDVTLDKLDMLTSMVSELLELMKTTSDVEEITDEVMEDDVTEAETEPEPEPLETVKKSLAASLDKTELALEYLPQIMESVKSLGTALDSIVTRLDSLEKTTKVKSSAKSETSAKVSDARSTFEAERKAETKSVSDQDEKPAITKSVSSDAAGHPGKVEVDLEDATTLGAPNNEDASIKSILNNKNKIDAAVTLVGAYKSLYGSPVQVAEKKEKIFRLAAEELGLSRVSFKRLAEQVSRESNI